MNVTSHLRDRNIVVAVCGGIAAYKAADLVSRLRKEGARVRVTMTESAARFVAPLTFEAVSGEPVYRALFGEDLSYRMEHIEWARRADALVVAPATASFISRMASGLADDAPGTLYLAYDGPTWIAPAMNTVMWEHPATRANVATLVSRRVRVIGPGSGPLACGETGDGRLAEPAEIVRALDLAFASGIADLAHRTSASSDSVASAPAVPITAATASAALRGKHVLITSGPTREYLDPIRFISNRSTGRMGVALARAARSMGARVTVIHGPMETPVPPEINAVPVSSAAEMLEAVRRSFDETDIAIFAAAVANYRSAAAADAKLKGGERLTLDLVRNADIAAWAGSHSRPDQLLIGFAAESENLVAAARAKLTNKGMDLVVANPIGVEGVGFGAERNSVILLDSEGGETPSGDMPKDAVAQWILDRALEFQARRGR